MTPDAGAPAPRTRRRYLDWIRGLAVLIMIEAHVIDSWTGGADRATGAFGWSMILGGFGAPLFLFLAGVAVPLSAGAKFRRTNDRRLAARAVARRGFEIFLLAFLFRAQAWVLGWSSPRTLLRVDILNIMGPSICVAALIWGIAGSLRARYAAFGALLFATTLLTPVIRSLAALAVLPDPVEAYIRPTASLSNFVLFPWTAFVFAGALIGLAIDATTASGEERRLNLFFCGSGALIAASAYGLSFAPSPYASSEFWTTSPTFFFLRGGVMTAAIGLAYFWGQRRARSGWSFMEQLGRTSLFIYWIHVELVYGLVSMRLHKALTLEEAWLGFFLFSALMLLCSIGKDRFIRWWRRGHTQPRAPLPAGAV
jgi:uncharacterized membrane protein